MLTAYDTGLLILRLVLGAIFIAHGSQKLFGWFGGRGMTGQRDTMQQMGMRPPMLWAFISGCGEFFGGLGVLVGLLTPLAATGIFGSMLMAIIKVHWPNGFWNNNRGLEYPLMNLTTAFVLGLIGPGAYSLDALLGLQLPEPWTYAAALILAVLAIIAGNLLAAPPNAQRPASAPARPGSSGRGGTARGRGKGRR